MIMIKSWKLSTEHIHNEIERLKEKAGELSFDNNFSHEYHQIKRRTHELEQRLADLEKSQKAERCAIHRMINDSKTEFEEDKASVKKAIEALRIFAYDRARANHLHIMEMKKRQAESRIREK